MAQIDDVAAEGAPGASKEKRKNRVYCLLPWELLMHHYTHFHSFIDDRLYLTSILIKSREIK
jgi:hypothetical protein